MRIVLFTRRGWEGDPLFLYLGSHVAARYRDVSIVQVAPAGRAPLRRWRRKLRLLGLRESALLLTGLPLQRLILRRDRAEVHRRLALLPRPRTALDALPVHTVSSVNGPETVALLASLEPDVLMQAGAGILRRQVFSVPRRATLNLHHGIAPLIRGVSSLYWARYERRDDWAGATVHRIDDGIDTGAPLGYAPVAPGEGESVPSLFARVTEAGVETLLEVLARLERGEEWQLQPPPGASAYRSSIDGWRLLALELGRRGKLPRALDLWPGRG